MVRAQKLAHVIGTQGIACHRTRLCKGLQKSHGRLGDGTGDPRELRDLLAFQEGANGIGRHRFFAGRRDGDEFPQEASKRSAATVIGGSRNADICARDNAGICARERSRLPSVMPLRLALEHTAQFHLVHFLVHHWLEHAGAVHVIPDARQHTLIHLLRARAEKKIGRPCQHPSMEVLVGVAACRLASETGLFGLLTGMVIGCVLTLRYPVATASALRIVGDRVRRVQDVVAAEFHRVSTTVQPQT